MEDAGDGPRGVLVVARPESAEDLAALSVRDLLVRRAACDAVIDQKSERFFEALNRWLSTVNPVFAGMENVLTVESWRLYGSGAITYQCRLGINRGHLTVALFNALGTLGLVSMMPDFASGQISLTFPLDSLDVSDMSVLVERARAVVEAERLAEEAGRQRLVGPEVADAAVEVRAGAVAAARGDGDDASPDLGPDQDGDGEGMPG